MTGSRPGPTLDEYWDSLSSALPAFAPDDQRVAVTIYRELAKGEPVSVERLAAALDVDPAEARKLLAEDPVRAFVYPDGDGRILGFGGLAAAPMHHSFEIEGRSLWTWCAWDSLFLPSILNGTARVSSPDPETNEPIRLTVSPTGVESVDPESTLVSFLEVEGERFDRSAANIMASFCHFVYFFVSRASGERWASRNEGAFLCSLDEAHELAERLVARQFGEEIARRAREDTAIMG